MEQLEQEEIKAWLANKVTRQFLNNLKQHRRALLLEQILVEPDRIHELKGRIVEIDYITDNAETITGGNE